MNAEAPKRRLAAAVRRRLAALAAAALVAFAALPASADVDVTADLGFGGRWIVDAVTPLVVRLANSGAEPVALRISVRQGAQLKLGSVSHVRGVVLGARGAREEVFLVPGTQLWGGSTELTIEADDEDVLVHSGNDTSQDGTLRVEVGGQGMSVHSEHIGYATRVLGVVGDARGVVQSRIAALGLSAGNSTATPLAARAIDAVLVAPSLLRFAPLALEGLDTLVLCDPDATAVSEPAVVSGLLDWVAGGRTLVISLGEHAGSFAASPLAAELPATFRTSRPADYGELLDALGAGAPSDAARGPWTSLAPNELTADRDGPTAGGEPAMLERRLGMGRVIVLAWDLRNALAAPGLDELGARALLDGMLPAAPEGETTDFYDASWSSPSIAIGRVLGAGCFSPPPTILVILAILAYVVVVGPFDWLLLKRLGKQRLTSLTFLGAVASFTVLAYAASFLFFASGSRVNRLVFADLADAGQGGRQVVRFTDIVAPYSATGTVVELGYPATAAFLDPLLPGNRYGGESEGSGLQIRGGDALHPRAALPVGFRSQRVARAVATGTLGPTIDVEWEKTGGVKVTNGLAVDLYDAALYVDADHVYVLGSVPAGGTATAGELTEARLGRDLSTTHLTGQRWFGDEDPNDPIPRDEVRRFLEDASIGGRKNTAGKQPPNGLGLEKCGLSREEAFRRGRGLLVAHATRFPLPLPADDEPGETYVVLRKEIRLP